MTYMIFVITEKYFFIFPSSVTPLNHLKALYYYAPPFSSISIKAQRCKGDFLIIPYTYVAVYCLQSIYIYMFISNTLEPQELQEGQKRKQILTEVV